MLGWRFWLGNLDDKKPVWPPVHCGFIWTSRCWAMRPAVGRVSADRHRFAVVPVATNSFAALTGRPP
jgi:hypothetical protein